METQKAVIESIAPLLMHNGQLADPMNDHSRAVSDAVKAAKKSKTPTAWEAAYRAEFLGGLYLDENLEPCLPGEMLEAVIIEGAKKTKQGRETTAAIIVDGNFPLLYKGPRKADQLWKEKFYKTASAKVGKNRVMRTRPMFQSWSCEFLIHFNPSLVDRKDLIRFLAKAGAEVGVGDFRPRYGRFVVRA
jgi:hypothetical protein